MNLFFFNKTSHQKVKMNRFTVLESWNRFSTSRYSQCGAKLWWTHAQVAWVSRAAKAINKSDVPGYSLTITDAVSGTRRWSRSCWLRRRFGIAKEEERNRRNEEEMCDGRRTRIRWFFQPSSRLGVTFHLLCLPANLYFKVLWKCNSRQCLEKPWRETHATLQRWN